MAVDPVAQSELSSSDIEFLRICAAPWDRMIELREASAEPIPDRLGEVLQRNLALSREDVETMGRRLHSLGLIQHPSMLYYDHLSLIVDLCPLGLSIDCITWLGCAVLGTPARKRRRYGGPR